VGERHFAEGGFVEFLEEGLVGLWVYWVVGVGIGMVVGVSVVVWEIGVGAIWLRWCIVGDIHWP